MAGWRNPDGQRTKPVEVKFTLRPELHALIRAEAVADDVSQAQIMRRAIRRYFESKQYDNA